uniref:Coactosin-like protein n=1 Tax=Arion vulgaris TaxID=1028688 RepID=A0A0B7AS67_9EUPU
MAVVDLKKNKDSLTKSYEKVQDDKDDTDWALYGYEGQTPVLKVIETGNGGIEELVEELSSGKMMYAYCRIQDPNTGLFKFVLIHWTGEGVPENIKLKYTSHLKDVQSFLRSIHITIPARSEDDIDKDDITKKVAKSSGANYSFHKEKAKPEEPSGPVGTDYKRIIPTKEINIGARDQFWTKTEKDEISRQNEEKVRLEEERKRAETERKEREIRETKEREKRISEHAKDVNKQRQAEKKADEDNKENERQKWEKIQKESSIDEDERGHRSDQMRKERQAEAAQLVSSKTSSARDFFKQKSVERPDTEARKAPPPPRKIRHGFGDPQESVEQGVRKEPIKLPARSEPEPPSKPTRQPEPEPEVEQVYEPEPEPAWKPAPVPARVHEPAQVHEPVQEEFEPTPEVTPTSPKTRDLLRDGVPPRRDSDAEDEDQDWDAPPAEDFEFREKRVPSFHEDYTAEQHHAETQSHRVSGAQHFEEVEEDEQQAVPASSLTADQGKCARALYDYQAADDTEISFDPDDIITNIEEIDDGWWQGFAPNGAYGMFPSNYVELVE